MDALPGLFDVGDGAFRVSTESDEGVGVVDAWFRRQPKMVDRFANALRQSLDEVLDGGRTGRFDVDQLEKTEKTYLGTKVEIVVRSAFSLSRGSAMDYRIDGQEVDAKFTSGTTWTIPREAVGHVCLLMQANDHKSSFRVGLLRIEDRVLNPGANQDGKRSITSAARSQICWLVPAGRLPVNLLLQLPSSDRDAIFHASDGYRGAGNGGQLRINELFRRVQGVLVDRLTALTVASQLDPLKRVRDAREKLQPEGILILGHQDDDPRVARELGLPIPSKGSFVAARVVEVGGDGPRPSAIIGGRHYAVATPNDPIEVAPIV